VSVRRRMAILRRTVRRFSLKERTLSHTSPFSYSRRSFFAPSPTTTNDTRRRPLCSSRASSQPEHSRNAARYKSLVMRRSVRYFSDIDAPVQGLYCEAAGRTCKGTPAAFFCFCQKCTSAKKVIYKFTFIVNIAQGLFIFLTC